MGKQTVCLFGASGTMGQSVLKELWKRRGEYRLVLLLRASKKNIHLIRKYARQAGLRHFHQDHVVENDQLKIVWGDATCFEDVCAAITGSDWVLDAMAYISPQADYHPEQAQAVNSGAIANIVSAIEAEPGGAEHIRLIYTGTVAATGDRLPPIHWGRVGDPLMPSIFDFYAVTKIAGECCVLESRIQHWVSLRMTYIMPTQYRALMALMDPIMFHQPLNTCMENISDRDAGFGMVNCLNIASDSTFWRRIYNMGGGPTMRITAEQFMDESMQLMGLSGIRACTRRNWFALRNFHMQFYADSEVLDSYIHHWRDSMADCWNALRKSMPPGYKLLGWLSKNILFFRRLVEGQTKKRMQQMAVEHPNGTAYWFELKNKHRMTAFFGNQRAEDNLSEWGSVTKPSILPTSLPVKIDHGYDESKVELALRDLQNAAHFRGGECVQSDWSGDWFEDVSWHCAQGHRFLLKPNTVLKGGHWCPECAPPPWNYGAEARRNPFFAQVWYPNHAVEEDQIYPLDLIQDIRNADFVDKSKKRMRL